MKVLSVIRLENKEVHIPYYRFNGGPLIRELDILQNSRRTIFLSLFSLHQYNREISTSASLAISITDSTKRKNCSFRVISGIVVDGWWYGRVGIELAFLGNRIGILIPQSDEWTFFPDRDM